MRIWALTENGRIDEGIEYARQSSELFPDDTSFMFRVFFAEHVRGRPDRALAWLYASRDTGDRSFRLEYEAAASLGYERGRKEALEGLLEAGGIQGRLYEAGEAGDYERALDLVRDGIERDGFADWEVELFFAAIIAGRCEEAFESRFAFRLRREWSAGEPRVDATNDGRAVWTAYCMRQWGEHEQAEKLLRAALAYAQPRPDRFDEPGFRNQRISALAMLGERERALEEWQAYYDAGFGSVMLMPYEDNPRFKDIADDPEFQRILAAIQARNERRLERMIDNDWSLDTPL
jgi:tetratricopeptide (TPR) repeat protein